VAPLNEKGETVERKGFHMECTTDLDCFSRCGSHPVTGMHYVCTHNLELYSHAGYSKRAYNDLKAESTDLAAKGEAHVQVWLPEAHDESFYLMEEFGDDKFDIERGTGVCTDTHIDYMHTGCMDANGARSTLALTGCTGKAFGWSNFFCGSEVDFDEDFVSGAGISARTLIYPRTLVEGATINGKTQLRQTCSDPLDCMDKCDFMERHARDNGLPAPTACALCDPPCPSNIGETLVSTVTALRDDIVSAIRLAVICLNPVACVCQARSRANSNHLTILTRARSRAQVFMMLKPAWIDNLPNELQECSVPDIMMMILDKVAVAMIGLLEAGVNTLFIDPLNKILKPIKQVKIGKTFNILGAKFGFEFKPFDFIKLIKRLCIPYKDIKDCKSEADLAELAALLGCSFDDKNLWKRCYYERVRHSHFELFSAHHPYMQICLCLGQVDLPGGRRDGQRLQGPVRGPQRLRAAGAVQRDRGRLVRDHRPVDAGAL
jgi:hypothetical protein